MRQAEMFLSAMTHTAILSVLITELRDLPRAYRLRKMTLRTPKSVGNRKERSPKPFIQEEELKTKLARLDELNILLNMDKRENEIVGGEPDEGEVPNTRKEKTYER